MPINEFIGGLIIGLAALIYLGFLGKIAGISGLIAQILRLQDTSISPAIYFVVGLILGPLLANQFGYALPAMIDTSWSIIIVSGFLVGFGTRLGAGCTSGHGICGVARFSLRSLVATAVFMVTAMITVFIVKQIG